MWDYETVKPIVQEEYEKVFSKKLPENKENALIINSSSSVATVLEELGDVSVNTNFVHCLAEEFIGAYAVGETSFWCI